MRIKIVRGASKSEVEAKNFNIYIGISLGNKWFSKENIENYLLWTLGHTKSKVSILIADTLHAINYEIKDRKTAQNARSKSLKEGDGFELIARSIIGHLPKEQREKIDIVRWNIIERDKTLSRIKKNFYSEFEKNQHFKKSIMEIVRENVNKSVRKLTDNEIEELCRYVLEELAEVVNGFEYNGIHYNLYICPEDTVLTQFVENLQNGDIFPDLQKKTVLKNNVFVQLEI